ncbi:MAG: universal stress protein [Acidobacteriia bacterium]|nr:universal stress protein [Terriglobia bacterium]
MLSIQKILLPIDFQGASKSVVHQAAVLARQFHSDILMLHVVTPLSFSAGALEGGYVPVNLRDLYQELLRSAQKNLDALIGPELEGLSVKRALIEGDPATTIVQTARDEKASLIVMPTHGYGTFRRFLLGSVTAKVLHDSECPVWTGAHLEEEPKREFALRNILCAVDLGAHSRKTVESASQLASQFGARLTLAHITPVAEVYGPDGFDFGPDWKQKFASSAIQQIAKLQQEIGTKAEVVVEGGDVPKVLDQVARQTNADVLVTGRPSHGRLRATGYSIIRESHIPVLSI